MNVKSVGKRTIAVLLVLMLAIGTVAIGGRQLKASATTTLAEMQARAEALVNYEWTPSEDIAVWNENPYNGRMFFKAGETVKGVPYTLFSWELGFDSLLSLEQYKTKTNYSTTKYCNSVGATRTGPAYGSCCATFVSEVFGGNFMNGSNPRYDGVGTIQDSPYAVTMENVPASNIEAGDAVSSADGGHIIWIGDVDNEYFTVYEETPPIARKVKISTSSINSKGYLTINYFGNDLVFNVITKNKEYTETIASDSIWNSDVEAYEDNWYYYVESRTGLIYRETVDFANRTYYTDYKVDNILVSESILYLLTDNTIRTIDLKTSKQADLLYADQKIQKFSKAQDVLYYLSNGTIMRFDLKTSKSSEVSVPQNVIDFWMSANHAISYMIDEEYIYTFNLQTGKTTKERNNATNFGDDIPLYQSNRSIENTNGGAQSVSNLRTKFPNGKYWNHVGNPGSSSSVNNQNGYTSSPCPVHGVVGTSRQTCNGFEPSGTQLSWQCMGYAEKCGYDVSGYNPRNNANGWTTSRSSSALDSLKAGDIVRYKNDGHSIYVIGVSGNTVTYTDCNSDGHCVIRWDATIAKSTLKSTFTHVRSCGSTPPVSHVVDSNYSKNYTAYLKDPNTNHYCFEASHASNTHYVNGADPCTIIEVYTDGCCKFTYTTDSGTSITTYGKIDWFYTPTPISVDTSYGKNFVAYLINPNTNHKLYRADRSQHPTAYVNGPEPVTIHEVYSDGFCYFTYELTAGGTNTGYGKIEWFTWNSHIVNTSYPKNYTAYLKNPSTNHYVFNEAHVNTGGYINDVDPVTIYEVYTDGCCKLQYITSAGAYRTAYGKIEWFAHTHSYSEYYEEAHPHKVYKKCYCGDWYYTGATKNISSCSACNPATYTVSFNANGGTGAPSSQTKIENQPLILSSTKPTRSVTMTFNANGGTVSPSSETSYFLFNGWNTASTGSGKEYDAGATYGDNKAATLYAQWINPAAYTLPTPIRTGYTCTGWNTKADGSGTNYAVGSDYVATANVTLYAKWVDSEKPTGKITSTNNVASTQTATLTMTDNVGLAGYYWGTDSDYTKNSYAAISGSPKSKTATMTVGAAGTYRLTVVDTAGNVTTVSKTFYNTILNANGGSVSPTSVRIMAGNVFDLPTPTRDGYTFNAWNTKINGDGTAVASKDYKPTGSVTLYAQWTANTYTVKYDANGGSVSPTSATVTAGKSVTLPTPTKTGYTFDGWYADAAFKTKIGNGGASYTPTTNVTLYAKWSAVTLTKIAVKTKPNKISYYIGDTFDSTGLTILATYNDGSTKTISSGFTCTPTKLNTAGTQTITVSYGGKTATFPVTVSNDIVQSLAVKSKPTKTSYYVGDTLNTAGLTLTATYASGKTETISSGFTCTPTKLSTAGTQTITVSYGGKTATFPVTVSNDTVQSIAVKSKPTKTSYYVGDSLNTAGLALTATYASGKTATVSSGFTCDPMTLNAIGQQNITVTYSGKTASFTVTVAPVPVTSRTVTFMVEGKVYHTATFEVGAAIQQPTPPTKNGSIFRAWTPSLPAVMPDRDLTVTAVFDTVTYNAVFIADGVTVGAVPYTTGDTAITEPAVPAKAGYDGKWSEYTLTPGGVTVYAVYTAKTFVVPLIVDGKQIGEVIYTYGQTTLDLPPVPEKAGCTGKWEYTLTATGADVQAVYTPIVYKATFVADGRTVATIDYTVETAGITPPAVPAKDGYTGAWEPYTLAIGGVTVHAVYTPNTNPPTPVNATVNIKNFTNSRTVDYKTTITFTAVTANAPAGATVHWIVDGRDVHTGETYTVDRATASYTVQTRLIAADGQVLAESETETVKVNTGFFAKLVAFFRGLFGSLPVLTQAVKEH